MAKFKKGSPEAKAWGKRMRALRMSKDHGNVNKPVSVKHTRKVIRISKKDKRRKSERAIHLVPDALAVGAGAALVGPEAGFIVNLWKDGSPPWSSTGPFGGGAAGETIGNIMTGVKPAAYLAGAAIGAKYIGKWLGLNRVGSKKVKLF